MPYQHRHVVVAIAPLWPFGPLRVRISAAVIIILIVALSAAAAGSLITLSLFPAPPGHIIQAEDPALPFIQARPVDYIRNAPSRAGSHLRHK
jgi:hypothetical protein